MRRRAWHGMSTLPFSDTLPAAHAPHVTTLGLFLTFSTRTLSGSGRPLRTAGRSALREQSPLVTSGISLLQTKFSYREGHEARRVGLEAMPLDQHIEDARWRHGDGNRGWSRLSAGTGNGLPSTTAPPRTWFCAWQFWVQLVAGGATSVASSPVTQPIRPPLATLHCEMPPQCRTVAKVRPSCGSGSRTALVAAGRAWRPAGCPGP